MPLGAISRDAAVLGAPLAAHLQEEGLLLSTNDHLVGVGQLLQHGEEIEPELVKLLLAINLRLLTHHLIEVVFVRVQLVVRRLYLLVDAVFFIGHLDLRFAASHLASLGAQRLLQGFVSLLRLPSS